MSKTNSKTRHAIQFSGKNLELVHYAIELAMAQVRNLRNELSDVYELADVVNRLNDIYGKLENLLFRIEKKMGVNKSD